MARFAVVCSFVLLIACFGLSNSAPLEDFTGNNAQKDMAERFVEFLKQDSQLSDMLSKSSLTPGAHLIRNRRANEMDDVEGVDTTTLDTAGTEGFFDRAAKFVMEVLQRFLKWINTDDK